MCTPAATAASRHNDAPRQNEEASTPPNGISNGIPENASATVPSIPSSYDLGWRRIVRNFSPSWFSVTMGTGVVSMFIYQIPWKADWLEYLSIILFVLNIIMFSAAFIASVVRYSIWPEIWIVMIQDPANSLFLSTMPIGFATLVELFVLICVPVWGEWASYLAWALWMLDSVVAVTVTISMGVILMSARKQRTLDTITAVQVLPLSATIIAAGTGSEVASTLTNPHYALGTLIAGYILWGIATPMAMTVLVMYWQRLALHKMPPREVIVSAFLPLGPLGFGGFTILNLGRIARDVFPKMEVIDPIAGNVAFVLGFLVSLIMWSWALLWLCFALASLYITAKDQGVPFNMGWWGFTFPLGVFTLNALLIGECMPSFFFQVLGTIFGILLVLLWIVIAGATVKGAWSGELFHAPCLVKLKEEHKTPKRVNDDAQKERTGS